MILAIFCKLLSVFNAVDFFVTDCSCWILSEKLFYFEKKVTDKFLHLVKLYRIEFSELFSFSFEVSCTQGCTGKVLLILALQN